jgi:hypothetical protein
MFCLSSNSITEHSEYKNWSPLSGRLRCFQKLRQYLDIIYPITKEELKLAPNSFHDLLYGCLYTNNKIKSNTYVSLHDLKKRDESGLLALDDDLKIKTEMLKDDIDAIMLRKSNNSVLKAIRNEKVISQSLQINKVSEIEDKEKIYLEDDKYNQEVDFSIIEEDTVINNKPENALSDLDIDEYYMKSCYEFYNYVRYINS